MIEIKNLTKKIQNTTILNDISFSVAKGEILGFLGPNGAGKTSTMKIITTFWSPTEGKVEVDGIDSSVNPLAVRNKIGYLPETVPLYDEMKVYEYLQFIAGVRGLSKDSQKKRIKEVVDDCGLQSVLRKPIEELSKGYRQRVGLAQAIMHNPPVLILDEPTTGLDPNQIVEIRELIKRLGKEKTVIFSTHILAEASTTCDRIVIINSGKIVGEGKPDELAQRSAVKESIYAKIRGPKALILEKLRALAEVEKAEIQDSESEDLNGFVIIASAGIDLRENISRTVFENSWGMIEFSRKTASLEDIFRELTQK